MDPLQMCGKGTSVTQLYRVEEVLDRGESTTSFFSTGTAGIASTANSAVR
jgi:hypothetical protein